MNELSAVSAVEDLGNTKTKSSKKSQEVKRYCLTLNNYSEQELKELEKTAISACNTYIFGREIGEECKTPHIQGYINLIHKKSLSAVIKLFNNKRIHFEKCKGTEQENIKYCSKGGDYITNIETEEPIKIISELRPWQIELDNIFRKNGADDRSIYWIWEPIGEVGKSAYCKYLCVKYNSIYLSTGKRTDLLNLIYNVKIINSKKIFCVNIPRNEGNKVSYTVLEEIKDGLVCNTKYETGFKAFNSPHLVVFANYPPVRKAVTTKRWKIGRINEELNIEWEDTLKIIEAEDH